jgi:hypothetical protein
MNTVLAPYAPFIARSIECGSRITCNPAPTDTDRDFLVQVPAEHWMAFSNTLCADGWMCGGSEIPDDANNTPVEDRFQSYTYGENNIIATISPAFYDRFVLATVVSTRLNLMDKSHRIVLFQALLYGNAPLPVCPPGPPLPVPFPYAGGRGA